MRWQTLLQSVGKEFEPAELRAAVLALGSHGAVSLEEKWENGWKPWRIVIIDRERLKEAAQPGHQSSIQEAIRTHVDPLPDGTGRQALLDALSPPPASWDAETIRIAAALIEHQSEGRQSLLRAFSTRLGDSKLVGHHIHRLERVLGSLGDYGIRRPGDMLLLAGQGAAIWPDARINLGLGHGAIGFERQRLRALEELRAENVLFIENKETFIAAAEGVMEVPKGLCVYMAGNFGSTVEHMLRISSGQAWMWADLDPYGVAFIRRATKIRPDLKPYMMEPHHLDGSNCKPLPASHEDKLSRELEAGGILQDILVKIRDAGVVLEHEGQLTPEPSAMTTEK